MGLVLADGAPGTDARYHPGYISATLYYFSMSNICADSLFNIDVDFALKNDLTTSTHEVLRSLAV